MVFKELWFKSLSKFPQVVNLTSGICVWISNLSLMLQPMLFPLCYMASFHRKGKLVSTICPGTIPDAH